MNQNIRRGLLGTLFAGGLLALGCTAASAADTTSGANGILSGTQVVAPVKAPITLGATSVGLLGDSTAANTAGTNGTGGNTATAPAGSTTNGSDGILSGTQVVAPVNAPITLGATSVGLLGDSTAANTAGTNGTGGNTATAPAGSTTTGSDGILSGTQVVAPVNAPITLGATSVGLLGDSTATTNTAGTNGTGGNTATAPAGSTTTGSDGILSGTQVVAPVTAPISVGSVSVGVAGDSTATVVTPPAGNEPVTGVPAIATPVTNSPIINAPATNVPAITAPATNTPVISAAAVSSPMTNLAASAIAREAAVISPAAAPLAASMLARTGADTNLVVVAVLFLAGGLLMMLVARRRNA